MSANNFYAKTHRWMDAHTNTEQKKMAILSFMQAGALKLKQYLCFDFEMSS